MTPPPRQLADLLPPELRDCLDGLWEQFSRVVPDPNPHGFVAWLYHQGLLGGAETRAILVSGHVLLTLGGDPDAPVLRGQGEGTETLGVIGRGAMGEVFLVRDRALLRTMAVKRTLPGSAGLDERLGFLHEAQITAQLDHPGIVPVYAFEGDADGRLSYSMKLVHGATLGSLLQQARDALGRDGRCPAELSRPALLDTFLDVCDAIAYAHSNGVVHRDLKPDNIMIARFGETLVMDWGIARPVAAERGGAQLRIVGTPPYMSPEQAMGAPFALEPASDQYTLGLILFEIVCLRRANAATEPVEAICAARQGQTAPMEPWPGLPPVPRELKAIVRKATQRRPADRYSSVADMAEDVRRYLRDEEVAAEPDHGLQRLLRLVSRHRGEVLSLVFGLAMLVVLVAVGLSALGRARLEAQERAAAEREEALAGLATAISRQAQRMDGELHRFAGLLSGLAHVAERALVEPPPALAGPVLGLDPAGPEAGLEPAPFYGFPIATSGVDVALAAGLRKKDVQDQVARLVSLAPTLRDVALRSAGPQAARDPEPARALLLSPSALPLVWTYVATADGLIVSFPGSESDYPEGYDPRTTQWYRVPTDQPGPAWSMLEADESGMGLLLTCSQALYDERGRFLGVAAVDVAFAHLVEKLLEVPALRGIAEAFLVDEQGRAVVRSSQLAMARTVSEYSPGSFEWADRLPGADGGTARGWVEIATPRGPLLLHWRRLEAVGWTYVVTGPRDQLLAIGAAL